MAACGLAMALIMGFLPTGTGRGGGIKPLGYPFPGFHGWVKDVNGYAIPGATVTANPGGYSDTTSSTGFYVISVENPGYYDVTASKTGFNDYTYNDVYTGSQTTLLSFTLSPKNDGSDNDGDGLSNYAEVNTHQTNPHDTDTDDDGLTDYAEINTHGTDPKDSDSDDDRLGDGEEVNTYGSDPLDADSDDDGYGDKKETEMNYDGAGHVSSKDLYIEVDKDSDVSWPSSSFWNEIKSDFQAKGIYVHILTDQGSLSIDGNISWQWAYDRSGDGYDPWVKAEYKNLYFLHMVLVDWIDSGNIVGLGLSRSSGGQRTGTAWLARGWCVDEGYSEVSQADVFSHEIGHVCNLADQDTDNTAIMYQCITTWDRNWKQTPDIGGRSPEKWMTPGYVLI